MQAIKKVAAQENVQLWVPVSIAQYSVYEALAAELMPEGCVSCTLDAATVALLNDKNKFTVHCESLNMHVPKAFPVTSHQQLVDYNSRSACLSLLVH